MFDYKNYKQSIYKNECIAIRLILFSHTDNNIIHVRNLNLFKNFIFKF